MRTRFVQHLGEEHFTRLRNQAIEFARAEIDCDCAECPLLVAMPRVEEDDELICPAAVRARDAAEAEARDQEQ